MKTFYQVSLFKNGNRSFTGRITAFARPENSAEYEWFDTEYEAKLRNKF
jgi:hypothetical protein